MARRTDIKRIRFTPDELQRFNDAYHRWADGKPEDQVGLADFVLDLIRGPSPGGPATRPISVTSFLGSGREDRNWDRRAPRRR